MTAARGSRRTPAVYPRGTDTRRDSKVVTPCNSIGNLSEIIEWYFANSNACPSHGSSTRGRRRRSREPRACWFLGQGWRGRGGDVAPTVPATPARRAPRDSVSRSGHDPRGMAARRPHTRRAGPDRRDAERLDPTRVRTPPSHGSGRHPRPPRRARGERAPRDVRSDRPRARGGRTGAALRPRRPHGRTHGDLPRAPADAREGVERSARDVRSHDEATRRRRSRAGLSRARATGALSDRPSPRWNGARQFRQSGIVPGAPRCRHRARLPLGCMHVGHRRRAVCVLSRYPE